MDRSLIVSDANATLYELDFSPFVLPDHGDAAERVANGVGTKLDEFIYHQEPAGEIGEQFRLLLAETINELLKNRLAKLDVKE